MAELKTSCGRELLTDFATIFAHMWYRDFPLQHSIRDKAQRADWTTHISIAVRSTADLMGLFTHFESGGRTDVVLRDNSKPVAALEWEWSALHRGPAIVNEFDKLKRLCTEESCRNMCFAGLIGYARQEGNRDRYNYKTLSESVYKEYRENWVGNLPPFLLVVIHFQSLGKQQDLQSRQFTTMTIDKLASGKVTRLRQQPACPWDVAGSRWALRGDR